MMRTTTATSRSSHPANSARDEYATKIRDNIEAFLSKLRRGKFTSREHQSQSLAAARECAGILRKVVELFHEAESQPTSRSARSLKSGMPAVEVATHQVATLIRHLTKAGAAMQRGPHFKLLLTNVTRRVLSIVREAADQSMASEAELENLAREFVGELSSSSSSDGFEEIAPVASEDKKVDETVSSDDDDDENRHEVDDDDVEMEGATRNFVQREQQKAPAASSSSSSSTNNTAEAAKPLLQRATLMLSNDESPSKRGNGMPAKGVTFRNTNESQPVAIPTSAQKRESERDKLAGAPEPSSLLSEFLSHTPPKTLLTRAPSVLGEVDVAMIKEYPVRFEDFVQRALDGIQSFEYDLSQVTQELCKRAAKQLHDLDTVITLGCSHSTMSFLLKATEDSRSGNMFKVIILEGKPLRGAQRFADALTERGVEVRVLPDSSLFAVMSTCTKAVIGVENVLANGGLLAPIGTHPLCVAAKHYSVPVIVVTMTLKMTPYYPSDQLCTSLVKLSRTQAEELPWSTFAFPGDVLPLDEWNHVDPSFLHELDVPNPVMEYVPPTLVSLFATNEGEYTVPQIHRIVRDNYNVEDAHL